MAHLRHDPISLDELLGAADPGVGAQVLFVGRVRNEHKGKPVVALDYDAHEPLAERMIEEILANTKQKWGLQRVEAIHRVGRVEAGGIAVVILTESAHRDEAYAANRWVLGQVKYEVPIWKCERFADGTSEWGRNSERQPEER